MNKMNIHIYGSSTFFTKLEINLDAKEIRFNQWVKKYDTLTICNIFDKILDITSSWEGVYHQREGMEMIK